MSFLSLTPQQIPVGVCPESLQSVLNLFAENLFVEIPDTTGRQWTFSAAKPSDPTVGWWKLDSLGRPERKYLFAQGSWLALHPLVPGFTMMWFNTLPDFTTFDGGDANPISPLSGPMWQLAKTEGGTVISAQFPIAQGTLPSGKVLNVGDMGGDEQNILTAAQTPVGPHIHGNGLATPTPDTANHSTLHGTSQTGGATVEHPAFDTDAPARNEILSGPARATDGTTTFPDPTPVSNMPPYACCYFLQRSQRLFYSIS